MALIDNVSNFSILPLRINKRRATSNLSRFSPMAYVYRVHFAWCASLRLLSYKKILCYSHIRYRYHCLELR